MSSILYKEPYEKGLGEGVLKGRLEGKLEGILEGRKEEKVYTAIKFLTKRFGILPAKVRNRLQELDLATLDVILDKVLEYNDLEEVEKYIQ